MKIKIYGITLISLIAILVLSFKNPSNISISPQSQECIDCHRTVTPGIIADWERSLHAKTTPDEGKQKTELSRRISSKTIPAELSNYVVGCYECHGLNKDKHADEFEHFGHTIHMVVSPNDCKLCHETEVNEYSMSKKGHAVENLSKNPLFSLMVSTYTDIKTLDETNNLECSASVYSQNQSCYACHGTEVKVKGMRTYETDFGEVSVPVLENWPNMGVGRINPDLSKGSCTSCHPRHNFSIETARKPSTCGQCHLEPDVPAYNIFKESKHGSMYDNFGKTYNFSSVPWVVGKDFNSPTCATCHNSLITDPDGNIISQRSHNFGARLWHRIFGLPYAHNQPKQGNTYIILNADNQNLPTTFANIPAHDFLIDENQMSERKNTMGKVCKACHGDTWVSSHFENLDSVVSITNKMTKTTTELVSLAWKKKMANPENPFEEPIEQDWVLSWLFYSNSIRYAAAMSGPDYAGFKNGWLELSHTVYKMQKLLNNNKKTRKR